MVYTDIYINLVSNREIKKDKLPTLSGVKIRIGYIQNKEQHSNKVRTTQWRTEVCFAEQVNTGDYYILYEF